jgi:copper transport protein
MATVTPSVVQRRRWFVALLVAAVAALVGPFAVPVAQAENSLASSSPAEGETLASSPTSLQFTFVEPLGGTNGVVVTCDGTPISVGLPSAGPDGFTLNVAVPNPLPKGECTAAVTVSAPDGSPNGTVTVSFTVSGDTVVAPTTASATATTVTPAVDTTVAPPTDGAASTGEGSGGVLGLLRLISSLALAVLFGSIVLIVLAWPEGVEYVLTVRFIRWTWVVALVSSFLMAAQLSADTTSSSFLRSLNPTTWTDLTDSASGLATLARVAFTMACGWVAFRPERTIDPGTQLPAIALPLLAVATIGFSRTGGDLAAVGIAVAIAHALAMAVWIGGLALLTRVVLAGGGDEDLVLAVRGYGRIATPAIIATVLTGAVQTFRLDRGALFTSGHGRVLLLKAIVVGAMVFVGLVTRQFVNMQMGSARSLSENLASRLRRATGIEAIGGIVVLALSSWLVSLTPPNFTSEVAADEYGYSTDDVVAGDLTFSVSITGVVGRNAVLLDVSSPESGITNTVVTFIPPVDSAGSTVVLSIPPEVPLPGQVLLPEAEGVPLEVPGVWTVSVTATTPTGEKTAQKRFTLLSA